MFAINLLLVGVSFFYPLHEVINYCVLGVLCETCSYNLTTKLWEPAASSILLERENTHRETNQQDKINIFNIRIGDKINLKAFVMPGPNPSET